MNTGQPSPAARGLNQPRDHQNLNRAQHKQKQDSDHLLQGTCYGLSWKCVHQWGQVGRYCVLNHADRCIYSKRDILSNFRLALNSSSLVSHFVKMVLTIISQRLWRASVNCCKIILWVVDLKPIDFFFFGLIIAVSFYNQSQRNTAHKWRVNRQTQQILTNRVSSVNWIEAFGLLQYGLRSHTLSVETKKCNVILTKKKQRWTHRWVNSHCFIQLKTDRRKRWKAPEAVCASLTTHWLWITIKQLSLFSHTEAQICRVEIQCILVLEIMKCQTILC